MLKITYALICTFEIAVLIMCGLKSRKYVETVGKSVEKLMYFSAVSSFGYMLTFISHDYFIDMIGFAIYLAFHGWMSYMMLSFTYDYIVRRKGQEFFINNKIMKAINIILLADTVFIGTNIFTEYAFKIEYIPFFDNSIAIYHPKPWFYIHAGLCALLFISSLVFFWMRIVKSPRMYQIKYGIITIIMVFILITNIVYMITDMPFDLSLVLHFFTAIAINHYTIEYIPQYLKDYMQRMALDKMRDFIIMFDYENNSSYMNINAQKFFGMKKMSLDYLKEKLKNSVVKDVNGNERIFINDYEELRDEYDKYLGCFYVLHEITNEKKLHDKYRYLATYDSLTGVYNRSFFLETAESFMKSNPEETYLMIVSDLRQFKAINDVFGSEQGDILLKKIAKKMIMSDDNNRVYGRIGSDNFALCMPKKNFDVDEYLIKSANTLKIENSNYMVVNHIGVYEVEDINIPVASMCDRAMLAINTIKDDMQREVAFFDKNLRDKILSEQEILKNIIPAFENMQFNIYLQPQFSHSTGKILGVETLVRWIHPDKGMIPPNIFIPMMEKSGLISRLDRYVWRLACAMLKKWKKQGIDIPVSVNISPKDFYYIDIYDEFMSLIKEYDIEPGQIKLEITESAVMQDVNNQIKLIKRLQSEGFIVLMDDFGSGYSSLNTLKDIPVDILKMDMKFLEKSENVQRSRDIMQVIVEMSNKLGMPVIAEGVETKEQADFLLNIGCDIIQGYYYAKPMPVSEFEEKYLNIIC